jgi:hypothetical protein
LGHDPVPFALCIVDVLGGLATAIGDRRFEEFMIGGVTRGGDGGLRPRLIRPIGCSPFLAGAANTAPAAIFGHLW